MCHNKRERDARSAAVNTTKRNGVSRSMVFVAHPIPWGSASSAHFWFLFGTDALNLASWSWFNHVLFQIYCNPVWFRSSGPRKGVQLIFNCGSRCGGNGRYQFLTRRLGLSCFRLSCLCRVNPPFSAESELIKIRRGIGASGLQRH